MEESILFAKKYLEDLLSFFGLNIDVYATNDEEVIELSVPSSHMNGFLIGQRGDTMRALQYMTSTALANKGFEHSRVNVDIADYKKGRQDRLASQVLQWVEKVKVSGQPYVLQPMNAADRRIVHKVAEEHGLATHSDGYGRDRHVIIAPTGTGPSDDKAKDEPAEIDEPEEAESDELYIPIPDDEKISKKPEKAQSLDEYLQKEAGSSKVPEESEEPAEEPEEPEVKK
jgi:spoIIIJ-associated protein